MGERRNNIKAGSIVVLSEVPWNITGGYYGQPNTNGPKRESIVGYIGEVESYDKFDHRSPYLVRIGAGKGERAHEPLAKCEIELLGEL